jgi:hypothetical protein
LFGAERLIEAMEECVGDHLGGARRPARLKQAGEKIKDARRRPRR